MNMSLDDVQVMMAGGRSIEEIISDFDWREFESLVAGIFEANGFFVRKNLRFKTANRYEIDVFAVSDVVAFAVDCKEWGKGRDKRSGLRSAVVRQEERVEHLKRFVKGNPIAQKNLHVHKQQILPLVVTWLQEDLQMHNGSLIVPVWKLNSFLLHAESFSSTE
jgi:D-lyxose ketol-isomerase